MSRIVCGCSALVRIIQDGFDHSFADECEPCAATGGQYNKSPNWVEVDVDAMQMKALGEIAEKFPNKKNIKRVK